MTIKTKISRLVAGAALLLASAAAQAQTNATTSTNQANSSTNTATNAVATNGWKSSVAVGVTLTRGNADTEMFSFTANTEKKWGLNDLMFGADGLYGKTRLPNTTDSETTAETLHGFSQYNRLIGDGFFFYGRVDGLHDGVADIKYRLTLAPGAGYYFVTNKVLDLSLEAGPAYIKEQVDGRSEDFATLRLAQKLHYAIGPHAKVWDMIELLPQANDLNNYIINAEVGVQAGLSKGDKYSLRVVLKDSYNNVPAAGRLKNDLYLIAALAYKF